MYKIIPLKKSGLKYTTQLSKLKNSSFNLIFLHSVIKYINIITSFKKTITLVIAIFKAKDVKYFKN